MAENAEAQPQKDYTPPSRMSPEALKEITAAFESEGVPVQKEENKQPSSAPTTQAQTQESKPEEKKSDDGLPTLLRLAKERDSQRKALELKEFESAKPYVEALKAIPPHQAQAIARAIQSGDPVSLIAAAGMTHSQYNARLLGMADKAEGGEETKPVDKVAELEAKLAAFEHAKEQERLQSSRQQMLGQMRDILKDNPKFKAINSLGDYEGVEQALIRYHSQYGQLPGNTLEESVTLAAELHEYELSQYAEKFRPLLTPGTQNAVVAETRAPDARPAPSIEGPRTLTNSNTTAPAVPKKAPKTRAEIMAAIIAGRDDELE